MKKLYLVLCMALYMVALSACGGKKTENTSAKFDESTLKRSFEQTMEEVSSMDLSHIEEEDQYEAYVEQTSEEIAQSLLSFYKSTKEAGTYKSISDEKVTYTDGQVTVEGKVKFEKNDYIIRINLKSTGEMVSFSTEEYKTFSEKMVDAGLNTLLGMGSVFVVLIFISLIISLLKYVPRFFEKKQVATTESVVENGISMEEVEDELVDDSELVAVITAAIMASMGEEAQKDGLVVRSIRRVNHKWNNA